MGDVSKFESSGQWKRGVSGNPKGRPREKKTNILRELCKGDTYKVYHHLMEIISNEDEAATSRVSAIKFHQEAAWGKAPASLKIETASGGTPELMNAQQLAYLAQGKVDDFIHDLFKSGKINEYIDRYSSKEVKEIDSET